MQDLEEGFGWFKADKPYPTKCSNQSRSQKSKNICNPFEIKKINKINESLNSSSFSSNEFKLNAHNDETKNKISMKDLCVEDKQRIANLVKELARIGDEKIKLEKCLEDERKMKDKEVNEILLQQETLLNEKEKLLNKFSKTQEKLDQLKRVHKKANQNKVKPVSKPEHVKIAEKKEDTIETKHRVENSKVTKNQKFNPHKSSTPRELSPVESVKSKISLKEKSKLNESFLIDNHIEDMKKIDLMKQRMDLITEQQDLRKLLEQQESLFKEKQNQIIIQQKVHKERLEELNQIKLNNEIETNKNNNDKYSEICNQNDFIPTQQNQYIMKIDKEISHLNRVPQNSNHITEDNKFEREKFLKVENLNNIRLNSYSNSNLNSIQHEEHMNQQFLNNCYVQNRNGAVINMENHYRIEPKYRANLNYIENSADFELQNNADPYSNNKYFSHSAYQQNADCVYVQNSTYRNGYNHDHLNLNSIPQGTIIAHMNPIRNTFNSKFSSFNINENDKQMLNLPEPADNIIKFDLTEKKINKCVEQQLNWPETESNKKRNTNTMKGYETGYETDDMEESKLIEDLFFIK